jgi:hypothetical protein
MGKTKISKEKREKLKAKMIQAMKHQQSHVGISSEIFQYAQGKSHGIRDAMYILIGEEAQELFEECSRSLG